MEFLGGDSTEALQVGPAGPIPLILPLPRAVYSASVPPELLSTFLSLLWVQEADLYGTHQQVPLPSEFQQEMEPGRAEKSKFFSLGSLSVRPHVDSGCFPLSKATALVRQTSLTTTAAAHAGFLQLFPALTPSHLGVVMPPCCC